MKELDQLEQRTVTYYKVYSVKEEETSFGFVGPIEREISFFSNEYEFFATKEEANKFFVKRMNRHMENKDMGANWDKETGETLELRGSIYNPLFGFRRLEIDLSINEQEIPSDKLPANIEGLLQNPKKVLKYKRS